jgi:hypothetical protein
VRPEARGIGLGKTVVRKELEKQFVHWKFVVTYISLANIAKVAGSSKGMGCGLGSASRWVSTGTINCEFIYFFPSHGQVLAETEAKKSES